MSSSFGITLSSNVVSLKLNIIIILGEVKSTSKRDKRKIVSSEVFFKFAYEFNFF